MNSGIKKYETLLTKLDMSLYDINSLSLEVLLKSLIQRDKILDNWITTTTMKEEGRGYIIDNELSYRAIAFFYISARTGVLSQNVTDKLALELYYTVPILKEALEKLKHKTSVAELDSVSTPENIEAFQLFITNLEAQIKRLQSNQLLEEPISKAKVEEFKAMIRQQWEQSRTVAKVFEYFDAIENNPDEKLQWVGMHKIRFERAKIMFVEKSYQKIYNIEWGHMVSNYVSKLFLERVKENKEKQVIDCEMYMEGFDRIISTKPEINVAFISLASSFLVSRPLRESGNFSDYSLDSSINLPFRILGVYREKLHIIPLHNKSMGDGIVAMQLPGSMKLQRKLNESWIDQKLQLDVTEITDSNVKEILLTSNPNADINDEELLKEGKTGVLLEIDELIDFKVIKPESIIVARVKERID